MALITPEYKSQLLALHASKPNWGSTARRWSLPVIEWAADLSAKSVLDYGSGTGSLKVDLEPVGLDVREYDPGMPGKDEPPGPADLVVALDVLEHIEPDSLTEVLQHIGALAIYGVFAVIALYPAGNILPDGRNAHLIVESPEWWIERLNEAWKPFRCVIKTEVHTRPPRNPAKKPKQALVVRMEKTT